ncbi:MAG TPA: hypothetical protein VMD91_18300 [Candidatus Sulfotelmatobacter sp.]|nr:hypothetical protein [Candidatus Sulfotelmatobacter sp.]
MSTSEPTIEPRSGLLNVVDIIVAPNAAFARLSVVPTWGWAFLVATLAGIAGSLLAGPATLHAFEQWGPPLYAQSFQHLGSAERDQQVARAMSVGRIFVQFGWVGVPIALLVGSLVQAVVLLIGNAIGKGQGSFAKFYALSMTAAVVGVGLTYLLAGVIALIRGPGAYDTPTGVVSAVPGLAMLVPGATGKLQAFLSTLSVTALWSTALVALGMVAIARVSRPVAWTTALVTLLGGALIATAAVH